jgi:hypothetical protein
MLRKRRSPPWSVEEKCEVEKIGAIVTEISGLPDAVLVRVFSISRRCARFQKLRQEIAMTTKVR